MIGFAKLFYSVEGTVPLEKTGIRLVRPDHLHVSSLKNDAHDEAPTPGLDPFRRAAAELHWRAPKLERGSSNNHSKDEEIPLDLT